MISLEHLQKSSSPGTLVSALEGRYELLLKATSYNHPVPVTVSRATIRPLLLLLVGCAAAAAAQNQAPVRPATPTPVTIAPIMNPRKPRARARVRPPQSPFNPNLIVLDPAHGGADTGANLGSAGGEKDFDLAFASRLKTLLEAQQFTVVLTRAGADENPTADQRAETTNRSHPVACLLLHATSVGHGVHLFTSALTAPFYTGDQASEYAITPWDSAQAPSTARSLEFVNELSTSLNSLRMPLVVTRVSVRPIDSLTCAAVAIEIAPSGPNSSLADDAYQEHIAESIVTALGYWRDHAKAQIAAQLAAFEAANPGATATIPPAAKPKALPRRVAPISESPLAPDTPPHKPAPIERRPPPANDLPPAGVPR